MNRVDNADAPSGRNSLDRLRILQIGIHTALRVDKPCADVAERLLYVLLVTGQQPSRCQIAHQRGKADHRMAVGDEVVRIGVVGAGAVGNGIYRVQLDGAALRPAAGVAGGAGGLHAHSAHLGIASLHRGGHAGDQTASADGSGHQAGVGQVLQNFQSQSPLARRHIGVGVGVDLHHALLPDQLRRPGLPLGGEGAHQLHLAAPLLHPGQLHWVGVGGHDDDRPAAQLVGGVGHPLGVVA